MAKEIKVKIKLQIPAGKANPAPPIGPVLGQQGVNIPEFCKQFNARTQNNQGEITPVVLTVYKDRSFTFECKTPPVSYLLKKMASVQKGSGTPNRDKVGSITEAQVEEIAKQKLSDLNCFDLVAASKVVAGTARSMGITVKHS